MLVKYQKVVSTEKMLESIYLEQIRPYELSKFEAGEGMNVLFGQNGAGKTTVLEAVYCLATTKSFRASRLADLIRHQQDYGRIKAHINERDLQIDLRSRGRSLRLNEKNIPKASEFCSVFSVVALAPEHLSLISGSPEERRKYLDQILFFQDPDYGNTLQNYQRALKQKRALLKAELSWSHYQDQVQVWNQALRDDSQKIRERRENLSRLLQDPVQNFYQHIAKTEEALGLSYCYEEESAELERAEYYAKRVLSGAHRDELKIQLRQQEAQSVGSQGERASILLALKFAELEQVQNQRPCILLLDDVGITLDPKRREQLFAWLKDQNLQSLITTSDPQIRNYCENAGGKVFEQKQIETETGGIHSLWKIVS